MVVLLILFTAIVGKVISLAWTSFNLARLIKWGYDQLLPLIRAEPVQNAINAILQVLVVFVKEFFLPAAKVVFVVIKGVLLDVHQGIETTVQAASTEGEPSADIAEGTSTSVALRTVSPLPVPSIPWDAIASTSSSVLNTISQHIQPIAQNLPQANDSEAVCPIPMDIFENSAQNLTTAHFDVPGVLEKDIDIFLTNGTLAVSYNRPARVSHPEPSSTAGVSDEANTIAQETNGRQIMQSRPYGKFQGVVQLPAGTKSEEVKAVLDNGVLSVSYPTVSAHAREKINIAGTS